MRTDAPAHPFSKRAPAVIKLIDTYQPDIMGTQELTDSMITHLRPLFNKYIAYGEPRHSLMANEYNLIFFRKDRFQWVEGNTLWLSRCPDQKGSRFLLSQFPRIVTYIVLRDKTDGSILTVFNTHLDHLFSSIRLKQADVLVQLIRNYQRGILCILTGDFNDINGSHALAPLDHFELKDCINDNIGLTITHPLDRFHYHNKPIDHIFVSKQASVIQEKKISDRFNGIFPSDHYPVSAVISIE